MDFPLGIQFFKRLYLLTIRYMWRNKRFMLNKKRQFLSIAAYVLTACIAVIVIFWISNNFEGSERRRYIGFFLIGAFVFGKILNWLILKIFRVDISN